MNGPDQQQGQEWLEVILDKYAGALHRGVDPQEAFDNAKADINAKFDEATNHRPGVSVGSILYREGYYFGIRYTQQRWYGIGRGTKPGEETA